MQANDMPLWKRWWKTIQMNRLNVDFGGYAAEISFYVIWSIAPIMLALANLIAVIPISTEEILHYIDLALPDEVENFILPILENYLANSSTGLFSLGLIISFWPASNVFNTIQKALNKVYKTSQRSNPIFSRLFAYLATLTLVFILFALVVIYLFGEQIAQLIVTVFNLSHNPLESLADIIQGSSTVLIIFLFIMYFLIYLIIPNVSWPPRYSLPGAFFATVGFILVSQLLNVYLRFSGTQFTGNDALTALLIFIIWLYFNAMIIVLGAYINVLVYDFSQANYLKVPESALAHQYMESQSANYIEDAPSLFKQTITKSTIKETNNDSSKTVTKLQ